MESFIFVGLIIAFASFIQGLTGFGFALISIPLLSLVIDIKTAIPLGALCGLVINTYLFFQLKREIFFSNLKNLIYGSIIGIPIGVLFLSETDPTVLKYILSGIILIFVFLTSTQIIPQRGVKDKYGVVFGLASGLLGGAFNTNGPPILIYFYLKGWDKTKQKASIIGFFIFTSVVIVFSHILFGVVDLKIFKSFLYYLPVIIISNWFGHKLFKYISGKLYNKLILIGLTILGILLIIRA